MSSLRLTLSLIAAALLAACGGSQPPIGAPEAMPQSRAVATHADRGRSWMLPDATSQDLVYVAAWSAGVVFVYTYPSGKPVGELTDIPSPIYECVDKNGNVFIASADVYNGGIYEYAHGGTEPINFLPLGEAQGCSVDPMTGNLAAVNFSDAVYVYPNAEGTPTKYVDSNLYYAQDVAYDFAGNLFVDGAYTNNYFALLELPYGGGTLQDITLSGSYNDDTFSPILWDGKYLDLGSVTPTGHTRSVIYRLKISGSGAKVVGRVRLAQQKGVGPYAQFWIGSSRIVQTSNQPRSSFSIFKYPSGKHIEHVKLGGRYDAFGVVVSIVPSRSRIRK